MANDYSGRSSGGGFPWDDVVVLVFGLLLAEPFCHVGADLIMHDETTRGLTSFAIGLPIGIAGASFHWWKERVRPAVSEWVLKTADRWWPIALGFAFLFLTGFLGPHINHSTTAASPSADEIAAAIIQKLPKNIVSPIVSPAQVPPILHKPYSGESKAILDKDLSFISGQLNGPGLVAVSAAQKISPNISASPIINTWDRYRPITPTLEEIAKNLDQVQSAIEQRIKEHPYQADDLKEVIQGSDRLVKFRQRVDRLLGDVGRLKIIFDKSQDEQQLLGNASFLFGELQEPFVIDLNSFNAWITECTQRINAKIQALNQ